jgi:hypothetical protein
MRVRAANIAITLRLDDIAIAPKTKRSPRSGDLHAIDPVTKIINASPKM